MAEVIKFVKDWFAEVEGQGSPGRLRQVAFRKGATLRAEVVPIDGEQGVVESAHLRLADGTTALSVPLSCIAKSTERARAA